MKKLLSVAAALAIFALIGVQMASAAEFLAPAKVDRGTISIGATETHKNLYVAGAQVSIDGKTLGDLYAAGGNVDVNNDVEKDLAVAGGNVTIDGKVGNNLRAAGGTIKLNAPVGGDVLIAGGNIIISDKSSIGGDLVVSGGTVTVDAAVAGSVRVSAGNVVINSKVAKGVMIGEAGKNQGITFGSAADISGALVIYGPQRDIAKKDGAKVPAAEFRAGRMDNSRGAAIRLLLGAMVVKLLAMILALLLVLKLMPLRAQASIEAVFARPWSSLGLGFVALILIPIVAILTFVVVVGYYIGLILLALYVLALFAAGLVAALFLGAWIIRALTKRPLAADWQAAVLGSVALILIGWVPFIGWAVDLIVFLMAFGTVLRMGKARMLSAQK
jgi:hypothetical protein